MTTENPIRYFDMFAGVGGFRAGFDRAGGYECIGHCEIDKYADAAYRQLHNVKENEVFYDDATTIDTDTLPEFDLLCAGFPCQAFSVAGKRKGFLDPRGTLFFEIARVVKARKPKYLLLENVPGLLSHDKGRTFATILHELCGLGYSIEFQVLSSKNFGVPQSRRRVYIVGYLDRECSGKVLPILNANAKTPISLVGGSQGARVYSTSGLAVTQLAKSGGLGGKTGLYFIDLNKNPKVTSNARCITGRYNRGITNRSGESSGVLQIAVATKKGYQDARPGDSVNISFAGSNTKRGRVGYGAVNTLDTNSTHGVVTDGCRIRRLMPRECFRLQGFTDDQIDKLLDGSSDTQAYKQAGNAVTVNVVHALAERLKAAHEAHLGADTSRLEVA
jgi:DNA (cytosine-5)-methyltransferase 1